MLIIKFSGNYEQLKIHILNYCKDNKMTLGQLRDMERRHEVG